jgi:hypothetical protein
MWLLLCLMLLLRGQLWLRLEMWLLLCLILLLRGQLWLHLEVWLLLCLMFDVQPQLWAHFKLRLLLLPFMLVLLPYFFIHLLNTSTGSSFLIVD